VLTLSLQPTRRNVLVQDFLRGQFSDRWVDQESPWDQDDNDLSEEVTGSNRRTIEQIRERLDWEPDHGHRGRTAEQKHLVSLAVPLREVYDDLLTPFRIVNEADQKRFTIALVQIQLYLEEHSDALCTVYQMRKGESRQRGYPSGKISNLYQGP